MDTAPDRFDRSEVHTLLSQGDRSPAARVTRTDGLLCRPPLSRGAFKYASRFSWSSRSLRLLIRCNLSRLLDHRGEVWNDT